MLNSDDHVKSECLCLLAYFAIQTGRAKRTDVSDALVDTTFSGKINDLKARKNWWSRKFGNIAYAWKDAGLADSVVHGKKTPPSHGKGLFGQKGVQLRIKQHAVRFFMEDLTRCVSLAQEFLDEGMSLPSSIHEALFGFLSSMPNERLSMQEQEDVAAVQKSSPEGAQKLVKHYRRERDAGLALRAKAAFSAAHKDKLFCQACGVEPLKVYGVEVIEAHHKIPLSKAEEGRVTELDDFLMLCPSCHRAVHRIEDCDFNVLKARFGKQ